MLLHRLPLHAGRASVSVPPDGVLSFLKFGGHAYGPTVADGMQTEPGPVIAPFQQLSVVRYLFPVRSGAALELERAQTRDAFWDQLIQVDETQLGAAPRYRLVETGEFAAALPAAVRAIDLSADELARMQASQTDPFIAPRVEHEVPWTELERAAWPLDFQKVLLADLNDNSPGFAFQNGQWFTTWLSRDLPGSGKEDHWFAPSLLVGDTLVRPAPLSARTAFVKNAAGTTLPIWTLEWQHEGTTVRQEIFAHRSCLFARFELEGDRAGVRLAIGTGRRPNIHYWDDATTPERTPLAFFTTLAKTRREGSRVIDEWGRTTILAAQPFAFESLGPVEHVLLFEPDARGRVTVFTPQVPTNTGMADYDQARAECIANWTARLAAGSQIKVPSPAWQERIDSWRHQVEAITRVHYHGPSSAAEPAARERLSYGAYAYLDYFGIEEAWPVVALALWNQPAEAKRQAELMIDSEALAKSQVHHQYRNGIGPLAAATVALLTQDRAWLESIAPALIACARWTEEARHRDSAARNPLTRGLLPPHIYGGDLRDPATSLFSTVTCWRGMVETARAFRALGSPELQREGERLAADAAALHARIDEVIHRVTDLSTSPPFVPFALDIPSLGGGNEGPHEVLTATRFGTYWILFAPLFLELDFRSARGPQPNAWIFDYAQSHGGLWAGLPRFTNGIDAAYAIGYVGYLVDRAVEDAGFRPQAISALHAFMLHAASRNAHAIPETAGLFPYRLQRAAYEQLVRENPWNFGMYDGQRYIDGHISFTEPLGSGAGEVLWLIRRTLVTETRDARGELDGGLIVLAAVPADWLEEGKEIALRDCVTYYGRFSATIRSALRSRREIVVEHRFEPFEPAPAAMPRLDQVRVRLVAPGERPQELTLDPARAGRAVAKF